MSAIFTTDAGITSSLILCRNNTHVARSYFPVINTENSVFPTYKMGILFLDLSCPEGGGGRLRAKGEQCPSSPHLEGEKGMQPDRVGAVSSALPAHLPFPQAHPNR